MESIPPGRRTRPGSDRAENTARGGAKRPREPIGFGAYEYQDESSLPAARVLFLDAVREVASGVLTTLEDAPYQRYQELLRQTSPISSFFLASAPAATVEPHLDASQRLAYRAVRQALAVWSRRWDLNADWCRDQALLTLHEWEEEDAIARGEATARARAMAELGAPIEAGAPIERPRRWAGAAGGIARPFRDADLSFRFPRTDGGTHPLVQGTFDFTPLAAQFTLQFTYPFWNPLYGSPDDTAQAISALCCGAVQQYLEEIRRRAEARGLQRTPLKNPEYFAWLAAFQVAGESYRAIAGKVGRSPTAVTKGIQAAAEMIDLRPRETASPYRRY